MAGDAVSEPRRGYVQVYTGDGKGKTTAALGLVLRALGQGLRPAVLQFMKSDPGWGEIVSLRRLEVPVVQCGLDHWVRQGKLTAADLAAAAEGFAQAKALVNGGKYDVVVLDELVTALFFGLVSLPEVLAMVAGKPPARRARDHRPRGARRADRGGRPRHRDAPAQALLRGGRRGTAGHRVLR